MNEADTRDKDYARRLMALLMLHEGHTVAHVARTLHAARSSVNRWINWFTLCDLDGLDSPINTVRKETHYGSNLDNQTHSVVSST